ncbi:MAG: hypothetical protein LQ340_005131 [Diploschistes diacapsis]|nr:MAG: hypothetical protein LQ340_005131 [Diploschistes diacapsis]
MSEEQRMEEGRRMFQIFAARMFEQRVLTAYREKVARERQEKLLEELADEDRLDAEREAKKAKDAQKKKERKKQQKMAKEEEKQKREAEKATAEAAAKAAEEEKLEEQRQRKEEQRKKREAERKAQEEERMRKEADKLRRQQEIREQQAEQERKQREARDKEKKRKEEAKKKEREERAREREKKDREVAEQLELEAKAKAEKEARGAFEKETKEKARKEGLARQHASQAATIAVSPLVRKTTSAIQAPPGLGPASSAHASPHLQIATPVIPKAPTPMRARQPSQQGSMHSSPKSTQPPSGSSATSPSSSSVQQPPPSTHLPSTKPPQTHQPVHPPTSMPTAAPPILPPPGVPAHPYPGMPHPPGMSGAAYPSHFHPMPLPGMQPRPHNPHDASIYATQPFSAPPYRGFNSPSTMAFPPGINGARQMPPGRGSPTNAQATQAPIGSGATPGQIAPTSHSRHASASYESSSSGQTQPIARPTPISRPTNAPQDDNKDDVEDLSKHLGSSALLDDTDQALGITANEARGSIGPSGMRSARLGFVNPRFPDGLGSSKAETFPRGGWNPPSMGFGTPTLNQHPSWPSAPSTHWSNSNAFGGMVNVARQPRPMTIRILICQACKALSNSTTEGVPGGFGYHSLHDVLNHIEQRQPDNGTIPLSEFLAICETEGSHLNGGGTLAIQEERSRGTCVKWIPDTLPGGNARMAGGPGEIGSPIVGSVMPFGSAGRGFPAHGGGMQTPNF